MSNIKYIYLKKIHKVPANVTNYYNLVETIRNTYKQLQNIYLFAIINPQNPEALTEINSDVTFQQLKLTYHQLGWPSIKLLVTENQNYEEVLKDSWNLLNQSIVMTEKKNHDASTLINSSKQDHGEQIAPFFDNMGTQVKVQQIDNAQNTNKFDFQNNVQLQQFIDEIIDQKLNELGLLYDENKFNPRDYKFYNFTNIPIFTAIPQKKINIDLKLKNTGIKKWINPKIINKELNVSQKFIDLAPGSTFSVKIQIPYMVQHFVNNVEHYYNFEICVQNEQGEYNTINGQILIKVKAPAKNQLSPQDEKIFKLLELFPQKGDEYIVKFVAEHGKNKNAEQLVEELLQQNL
ncbi:unnamed protein product (macronuclear) [Paramecium tetraurelia]|uniref:Uncharacterized protein n=1 Tax=Paramecium tetraurelia TaxID=5888 RepID=A0C0V2_PARTE|nr:uncharacterized protein GSPATT00033895001 [Paramecium tetraurelia]CAK64419.1 unnamed protein product [Paramecium tetraurelia]|eukprot:XP_001431817.1 hypothetical protein (macronuclear) [Paramecium tetraurelia strain d4-2]